MMGTISKKAKILLLVCLITFSFSPFLFAENAAPSVDLLKNADFETFTPDGKSSLWGIDAWKGDAFIGITDQKAHGGKYAAFIQFEKENDARLVQTVPVEPGTVYRFSGWIATQNITPGKVGGNLCVMGEFIRSSGVKADSDWQYQEIIFRTYEDQTEVTLGARLGFWGETLRGTAYFDDLKLEKITDPGVPFQQLTVNSKPTPTGAPLQNPTVTQPKAQQPITVATGVAKYLGWPTWTILFYLLLLFGGIYLRPNKIDGSELREDKYQKLVKRLPLFFFIAAIINFLIRIPLFSAVPISNDIVSYKAWIFRMLDLGPAGFYANGYTCDYPPFPMYFLWLIGGIAKLFGITNNEFLFNSLIKLPALLCDVATGWLIFKLLKNKRPVVSWLLGVVYMFLPAVVYLSSYWGQVDSYYAFLMILSFYFIAKKKPEIAVIFVAASFFTKTQTVAFIPLLLFYLIFKYKSDWKRCFSIIGVGVISGIAILLPYSIGQSPTWIIDFYKYQGTIYHYAVMNAANFLTLLGGNFVDVSTKVFLGLSYYVIGLLLFFAAVIWSCYFYLKKRTEGSLAAAFFMMAFAFFMFFPLVHERYLYPALAFLILTVGYYKDKKVFFGAILLSTSYLLNLHVVVLRLQNLIADGDFNRIMYILSLINTGLFISYLCVFQMQIRGDGRNLRRFFTQFTQKFRSSLNGKLKMKPFKMTKRDYLILGVLILCYTIFIFFRLGSTNTPRTGMDFPDPKSGIEVTFENPSIINTVVVYDAEGTGQLQMDKLENGVWNFGVAIKCDDYYVMKRAQLGAQGISRVRFTPQSSAGHINEIAFLDQQNNLVPVKSVIYLSDSREVPASESPLFDEQQKMLVSPSYMNSTFFDEIYHGRTAYEFIQKSSVYETTHPHLGKDILSLGILMFGMDPFGMRFMHVIMGILLMILLFFLGREVLATRFGAYALMALGMLDFMPFVQSRYSTIDTTSVFFIGLMFLVTFKYVRKQEEEPGLKGSIGLIALNAFCFGLASSVKWTGVYGVAGIVACYALVKIRQFSIYRKERKEIAANYKTGKSEKLKQELKGISNRFWFKNFWPTILVAMLFFATIAPLTYYLTYIPYLNTKGIGITQTFTKNAFNEVVASQKDMWDYHSRLVDSHPFSSSWWSWPFDFKPLWIYPDKDVPVKPGNKVSIVSLGNPIIWFMGVFAVFLLLYQLLKNRRLSMMHFVILAFLSEYLPWVLVTRVAFIYHFYACLPFYFLFVAFMLEQFWEIGSTGKKVVYTIGAIALLLLIMFYPVLSGLEIPQTYCDRFLRWFPQDWVF